MSKDFGDLKCMGLHVLGEPRPGQREIVPHQVVDWMSRNKGCCGASVVDCIKFDRIHTKCIWEPENSVAR